MLGRMFELRHAYRGLMRRPAYTGGTVVGTLALVIGVNAALFAAINATLFRPIPLKSGERTVQPVPDAAGCRRRGTPQSAARDRSRASCASAAAR